MEIGDCREFDLEFEADDLIDNDQFPEILDAGIDVNDQLPEVNDSTEPRRNKRNGRCNMRQSLAWNSDFFTSAGVLDAEELSSIITGSDKKKDHILPEIQEEIRGSTESISTLQSDCLTLETLDDDVFPDIRASIQRTRASKNAPKFTNSSSKIVFMELDGPAITSPKKQDFVSEKKNQIPAAKKISGLQTVRMSKSQPKPTGKLVVASGRLTKQNSIPLKTGLVRKTEETNSVLPKQLKTIRSYDPSAAANPNTIGISRVKPECGSSKQGGKATQLPKASALGVSRKLLPKPAVSLKISSTTSSLHPTRSSTSSNNSINTSSANVKKTLMPARRNLSKSNNKLPATTKIPKSVSPASSLSEWSSVSSTTSSVVNQRCNNSVTSFGTSSCRSVDGDSLHLDEMDNLAGQKAQRKQGAISTSCNSKRPLTESSTLKDSTKLSGLRLPSSRIGFFDGSSSRTPIGQRQPQIPKNGGATSTPTRSSNGKLKIAKVSAARVANTSSANMKSVSPKASSSIISMDVNDSSSFSLGLEDGRIEETCRKPVEVNAENGVEQVVHEGIVDVAIEKLCDLNLNKNMKSGETTEKENEVKGLSADKRVADYRPPFAVKNSCSDEGFDKAYRCGYSRCSYRRCGFFIAFYGGERE